jgi:hypothetical protein
MKNDEMILVLGAAVLLYLIINNQGVSAAQAQINATNLTAGTNVANANLIANSATSIGNDISAITGAFSGFSGGAFR